MVATAGLAVWFDGALHGSGGTGGGAGAVVLNTATGRVVWQGARFLEQPGTSMQAEYEGLLLGLDAAARLTAALPAGAVTSVAAHGDCKMLVRQMSGEVVARKTAPLHGAASRAAAALAASTGSPVRFHFAPRANNHWADSLARGAIDAFTAAHAARGLAFLRSGRRRDALSALRLARSRGAPCGDAALSELLLYCEAAADWPTYLDTFREAQACGSPIVQVCVPSLLFLPFMFKSSPASLSPRTPHSGTIRHVCMS